MVFKSPPWVPDLDCASIPDSIPISRFMLDEEYNRCPYRECRPPLVHAQTHQQYSAWELKDRVDHLAKGLAKELSWHPNEGSEWDKVVAIYCINSLDFLPVAWAVHDLSGIVTPVNAAYGAAELRDQLESSGAKAVFTSAALLDNVLKAIVASKIDENRIYIMDQSGDSPPERFATVDMLAAVGSQLVPLPAMQWSKGQGARQCAFLNYSSGTSGPPKGVMVSHRNVIANIIQITAFESQHRRSCERDVVLGLLPISHIYGLVAVFHISVYRGDQVIILPKFTLQALYECIEKFRINLLYVVPPIIISILNTWSEELNFNLSSVREVFSGAAPLAADVARSLNEKFPDWIIRQGYGMTETATVVSSTPPHDIFPGSAGSLVPGVRARLISLEDGSDIVQCGKAGELLLQSPSVTNLGYFNNNQASRETFGVGCDRWLRTGDKAMFLKSPKGYEHLFIVDRIKELIKVKGYQVAPAELEALLLSHPFVADAAVIPVANQLAGEVPKAFIVLSQEPRPMAFQSAKEIEEELHDFVETEKAPYKWLKGGIELVDSIPKSPSGKILRRILRDQEKTRNKGKHSKL